MVGGGFDVYGENELDDLIDDIEQVVEFRATSSTKRSIERTVKRVFDTGIVPAARTRAQPHVGNYSTRIHDRSLGWEGDNYYHALDTDSVVVRSHEYGTGQFNINGNGTINDRSSFTGRVGYRIPGSEIGGPVSFTVGGQQVTVDYVVHPGVKPKRFMARTVEDYEDRLADAVEEAVLDSLDSAFD